MDQLADEYIDVGPGRMHYKHRKGNGAAVIFLPGLGASLKSWGKVVQYLDQDIDAYFIDLIGQGLSDSPEVAYTTSFASGTINKFIEGMGLKKCILCGHSYGGWVALLVAMHGNKSVRGLILEDSAGLLEQWNEINENQAILNGMVSKIRNFLGNTKEHVSNSLIENLGADRIDQKMLTSIHIPTLLIWGEKDEMVDIKYSKAFNSSIKGSTISVIRGAGHVPHYTNPQEVGELVDLFVPTV